MPAGREDVLIVFHRSIILDGTRGCPWIGFSARAYHSDMETEFKNAGTAAFNAILSRRTAHAYRDQPVPSGVMARALEAANHAPCHKRTYPWRFIRVGPRSRQVLAELAVALKGAARPLSPEDAVRISAKIMAPPELVVACQCRAADAFRAKEDYAACSCAIQNFCISLAGENVASKWSTGALTRDLRAWSIFGVDPGQEEVIGFLWAGYADPTPPVQRPPLSGVVRSIP